jgi:hypothetical protein
MIYSVSFFRNKINNNIDQYDLDDIKKKRKFLYLKTSIISFLFSMFFLIASFFSYCTFFEIYDLILFVIFVFLSISSFITYVNLCCLEDCIFKNIILFPFADKLVDVSSYKITKSEKKGACK